MPTLYVQLEIARGFENVADPRIVLRAGQQERQTLAGSISGSASSQTNRFTFPLGETDFFFELEAWSAGALGGAALGKTVLDFRQLQPEHWQRKREALSGPAQNIEIEFDWYLSMASVQDQPPGGSLSFSAQEIEHYRHLFSFVDAEETGLISSTTAASFLSASGLPDIVLGEILHIAWQIADTNFLTTDIAEIWQRYGFLTVEAFFVALRLIAHAQTHSQPSLQLAMVSPPALPEFKGLQQHSAVEQQAHSPPSPPPRRPRPLARRRRSRSRSRSRSQRPDVPRSYAVSAGGQGAASDMSGQGDASDDEWQPVIGGSPDPPQRQTTSSYSSGANPRRPFKSQDWFPTACEKKEYVSLFRTIDADSDGFVQQNEAERLLQRSGLDSYLLARAWEHADQDKDGRLTFKEFVTLIHLVTCTLRGAQLPSQGEGLPQELLQAVDEMMSQEGASSMIPGPMTTNTMLAEEAADWNQPWPDAGQETAAMVFTEGIGEENHGFGSFVKQSEDMKKLQDFQKNTITALTAHLEASISMDKDLVRQLQPDVVELEEELQSVQQSQNEQVVRAEHERELQQRQTSMVLELEQNLQDARKQIHQLRERRDHFRINREINFLKNMLDEEERTLEEVLRMSRIIEKSWKDVQAGSEALEGQRKLIQRQVAAEEELLRQAERQNAEMATRVEHFRRQQVAVATQSHEEHESEKRLRDIKAGTAADAAPKRCRQVSWQQQGWCWRPIFRSAVRVGGREGV